jgi:hypothetical protein
MKIKLSRFRVSRSRGLGIGRVVGSTPNISYVNTFYNKYGLNTEISYFYIFDPDILWGKL